MHSTIPTVEPQPTTPAPPIGLAAAPPEAIAAAKQVDDVLVRLPAAAPARGWVMRQRTTSPLDTRFITR